MVSIQCELQLNCGWECGEWGGGGGGGGGIEITVKVVEVR